MMDNILLPMVIMLGFASPVFAVDEYPKNCQGAWCLGRDLIASVTVQNCQLTLTITNAGSSGVAINENALRDDALKDRILLVTFGEDDPTGTDMNSRRYKLFENGIPGMGSFFFAEKWKVLAPGQVFETRLDLLDAMKGVSNEGFQAAISKAVFHYKIIVTLTRGEVKSLSEGTLQYFTPWLKGEGIVKKASN